MTEREGACAGAELWKGCYGKEPFDLRLTVLRMLHQLPMIAAVTCAGILLFGGGYYVKNVLLRSQKEYAATSVFRVEYAADSVEDLMQSYINEMSWNTYMQSQMFLEMVSGHLGQGIAEQELGETLEAFVWSDLRVLSVTVTADSPEKCQDITRAAEKALTCDFVLGEIDSISVIDPGVPEEVIPDVRVGRALILSGVLSCFFCVVLLLLKETGDDKIWLPSLIFRRYGVRTAGTPGSRGLEENLRYFFRNREEGRGIAVCMVQEDLEPEQVLWQLRRTCPETVDAGWFAAASPLKDPEVCRTLRQAGGILLAVKAGGHGGKKLEYVLEYLEQQDCRVTAAILWDADEKLINRYYGKKRTKYERAGAGVSDE